MTTENKLLPCPFCGSTNLGIYSVPGRDNHSVECYECLAGGRPFKTVGEAISAWNTRTAPPASHVPEADFGNNQPANQEWRDTLTVNLLRHSHGLTKTQIRELIDAAVSGRAPDESMFTPASQEQAECVTCDGMGYVDGVGDACKPCAGSGQEQAQQPSGEVVEWRWVRFPNLKHGVLTAPDGREFEVRDGDVTHPRAVRAFDAMLEALTLATPKPEPMTAEQKRAAWIACSIDLPSPENCYLRGIVDGEAHHGITKEQA
jgi:Lar family restriction alleviation protein